MRSPIAVVVAIALAPYIGPAPRAHAQVMLDRNVDRPDPAMIRLKSGEFDPAVIPESARPAARANKRRHCLLQLDGPLTAQRLGRLAESDIRLGSYIPTNGYIVTLPTGFDPAGLTSLPFVRALVLLDPRWKRDPAIGQMPLATPDRQALAAANRAQLVVAVFDPDLLAQHVRRIAALNDVVIHAANRSGEIGLVELTAPLASVDAIARFDFVQWIEEAPEPVLRNDTSTWLMQSGLTNVTPIWDHGIHGEGQIGGHIDSALKNTHCSFDDPEADPVGPMHRKLVAYFGDSGSSFHGTHTAGTFVGDEQPIAGTTTFRGVAYLSRMVFTNLNTEVTTTNLYDVLTQAHGAGATVHTNSWGSDGSTSYIAWTRDVDRFTYDFEDDLVLFASTNLDAQIRTPENAKNCIAVVGSDDAPAETKCIGGFGPTQDGRRKPELLAPGCGVLSSISSTACSFNTLGNGTSYACPAVAGAALLARQYYVDGYYPFGAANPADGFTPSGALLKATLMNAGRDMTGVAGYPGDAEGWGRVTLDDALFLAGDARRLIVLEDRRNVAGLTTGRSVSHEIEVTADTEDLKVTLVWTEKEAALMANPAYINDLDLVVTAPGPLDYLGNHFEAGESSPGGATDFRNNVEQVLIKSPPVGAYTVTVDAAAVNTVDPQGYALIVTGAVGVSCAKGDVDGDGMVTGLDVRRFIDILLGADGTLTEHCAGDVGVLRDSLIGDDDVPAFVDCVLDAGCL